MFLPASRVNNMILHTTKQETNARQANFDCHPVRWFCFTNKPLLDKEGFLPLHMEWQFMPRWIMHLEGWRISAVLDRLQLFPAISALIFVNAEHNPAVN